MFDLAERRRLSIVGRRGWLVRRALAAADLAGLLLAFIVAEALWGIGNDPRWWPENKLALGTEVVVFLATLPGWILVAKLYGLYRQDEQRTAHSTADDLVPVFHMVTVGVWLLLGAAWLTKLVQPQFPKILTFWAVAITLVTAGRVVARRLCRRHSSYIQNTLIVGAGDVGRLIARKLGQHPEYGLNLVGVIDSAGNGALTGGIGEPVVVGTPEQLPALIRTLDIERVILAFSHEADEDAVGLVHELKKLDVQIDIVPRLFEVVGPGINIHTVEGVTLIGLPPSRLSRSSQLVKRMIDVGLALVALIVLAPLFALLAWRVKRDSPGPVFFRQVRLGLYQREITMLKFRTMNVETDTERHREYVKTLMDRGVSPEANGLYKLDLADSVTPFGRFLRRTSLDELPQLINVLRGEMSLVGPRPCLPYEVEHFKPHHFERFLVRPGLTGLWQVTARARSTFVEALELDVAYVRGWSLGLDLRLLLRTPLQLLARSGTA